jgi:uncharacterized membrane protein YfcA
LGQGSGDVSADAWRIGIVVVIGLVGGVCGGVWGIGAGWVVVPPLLLLGVPYHIAVGTSTIHMAAKSLVPTVARWRALQSADRSEAFRLAWPMALGSVAAVVLGVKILSYAKARESAPLLVDTAYVVLLALIVGYGLYARFRKPRRGHLTGTPALLVSGGGGLVTGVLAGLLGIGGGLVRRPLLTYVIRTPEVATGAIGQITVLLTSVVGFLFHWRDSNIDWRIALPLIVAGVVGQWLGTLIAQRLDEAMLRAVPRESFLIAAGGLLLATVVKMAGCATASRGIVLALGVGITGLIVVQLGRATRRMSHM